MYPLPFLAAFLVLFIGCAHEQEFSRVTPEMEATARATATRIRILVSNAREVALISLDPLPVYSTPNSPPLPDRLPAIGMMGKFKIIGQASSTVRTEIQKLAAAIEKGIYANDARMTCFVPRHALSFTDGKETVQIIICFHCANGEMIADNKLTLFSISSKESEVVFDSVFSAHGLPKAKFPVDENGREI
ncbi:MAG: hypothetical protein HY302_06680 [Opitutae bacterium]|nr:hypothetical protein [Opitutae bacterium]